MTDLRKAAEMALEALEFAASEIYNEHNDDVIADAIKALRQALAQKQTKCPRCGEVNPAEIHTCSPQVAQEQEPIAWKDKAYGNLHHQNFGNSIPLYTAPPKQLVGLHLNDMPEGCAVDKSFLRGARWAEAKLKEKNT